MEASTPEKFKLEPSLKMGLMGATGIGALLLGGAFYANAERAWHAYLVSYFFFTCLSLGGLFFAALQHVAAAGWSVNVRRVCESFTAFLPMALLLGAPLVLFAGSDLWLWLDQSIVSHDKILQAKEAYLNQGFFSVRFFLFAALWIFFSWKLVGFSVKQDEDGAEHWTQKSVTWSVAFLLVFSLSFSLFSVDMIMSLEPHWFSTIFGVYCLAGLFQSFLALLILVCLHIMNRGWTNGLINIEHVHDIAKFMKGFTVFWAYIAFSQFMLIWYANLPEETIFYLHRSHGGWLYMSIGLLVFRFVVPFLALLPRWAKRTPAHLIPVCILILVMQYVDLYWLVYPNYDNEHLAFSWYELAPFICFAGLFGLMVAKFLSCNNIMPIKDPRREESANHHVTY